MEKSVVFLHLSHLVVDKVVFIRVFEEYFIRFRVLVKCIFVLF